MISEHDEQTTLIAWAKYYQSQYPELGMLFAIPNGGLRNKVVAAKLKAEGVKPGVPDLFLSVARKSFHGLYIEMKAKTGKVSDNQKKWIARLSHQKYAVQVCYGFEEAVNTIVWYLGLPDRMKLKVGGKSNAKGICCIGRSAPEASKHLYSELHPQRREAHRNRQTILSRYYRAATRALLAMDDRHGNGIWRGKGILPPDVQG